MRIEASVGIGLVEVCNPESIMTVKNSVAW